jgi:hypothetical protein
MVIIRLRIVVTFYELILYLFCISIYLDGKEVKIVVGCGAMTIDDLKKFVRKTWETYIPGYKGVLPLGSEG